MSKNIHSRSSKSLTAALFRINGRYGTVWCWWRFHSHLPFIKDPYVFGYYKHKYSIELRRRMMQILG